MVSQNISAIGDSYLGVYENVVAVYTDFYQAFSDILSKMEAGYYRARTVIPLSQMLPHSKMI